MYYSELALSFENVKQGSKKHKNIVDEYNKIVPLPRGYKATYTDSWCAIFASYILHECNAVNAPYECSVYYMYELAKQNRQIVDTPTINDLIIYDWKKDGTLDHVGIIYMMDDSCYYVIEGNKSKAVGTRKIKKDNSDIHGFIHVEQAISSNSYYDDIVTRVIRGEYGNGLTRKHKIESMGLDYNIIQNMVNDRMKK